MKIAIAILAGSFLGTLATVLLLAVANVMGLFSAGPDAIPAFATFFAIAFAIAVVMASTVGLAWHAFAQARGWRSVHAYWPAGIAAGLILATALVAVPSLLTCAWDFGVTSTWIVAALYSASIGGFSAVFAWLIRRPDRDAPNPATPAP